MTPSDPPYRVEQAIVRRLSEVRRDFRVALVTPNRTKPAFSLLYSFAYENCHVRWFVPDGPGNLRDREGMLFDAMKFDVIWCHQLRFATEVKAGHSADPARVLMPELVAAPMREKMRRYLTERGGGLLMTGISGLYVLPLGIETTAPDRVMENRSMHGALAFQLSPAPAQADHPIYAGFTDKDMLANAVYSWIPQSVICECAWEKAEPSGVVLVRQTDNGTDATGRRKLTGFDVEGVRFRGDSYAPVVEYRSGTGKVLVLGGLSVHMSPAWGRAYDAPEQELRRRIRKFTLNALEYLASPAATSPAPASQ